MIMNYPFLNEYEVDGVEFQALRTEDYIKVGVSMEGSPLLLDITVFKTGKYRVDFPIYSSSFLEKNENFLIKMIGERACTRVEEQEHANFAALVEDMFESAEDIVEIREEVASLKRELNTLRRENEEMRRENEEMREEVASLKLKLKSLVEVLHERDSETVKSGHPSGNPKRPYLLFF
jgi:FtsZ-binding cell division protein ZapB